MKTDNQKKAIRTRLLGQLAKHKISFEELQYISKEDFIKWRGMGAKTYRYACDMLASQGMQFGEYALDYYLSHKDEIRSGRKAIPAVCVKQEEKTGMDMDALYFRRGVAKDILAHLAGCCFAYTQEKGEAGVPVMQWTTSCPPEILAKKAVELADALIAELKEK